MKFAPILVTVLTAIVPASAIAHTGLMKVKVMSVKKTESEYLVTLEPQKLEHLPKRMTIHLRYNPEKAASGASKSKEDFEAALKDLETAAAQNSPIKIGLMSSKGFNPIRKRPGHYRSEMIQRVDWFKIPNIVCFFHCDHYAAAPK